MTKIFEIRKAGFLNKGAAMMLIAATRELQRAFPGCMVVAAPDYTIPFQPRAELGLWHRAEHIRLGFDCGKALHAVPRRWRRRYGFVIEKEIDVIIDAAGFHYSEQWRPRNTLNLARRARRWARQGKKLILLPQAFGPFTSKEIRQAISEVADCATLIFARDDVSYRHLVDAVGQRTNIKTAPDFTNLLESRPPIDFRLSGPLVALVPNCRMLDRTTGDECSNYVPLLRSCAEKLRSAGMAPFLLIHEGPDDRKLAEVINRGLAEPLEIVWPEDPLQAKGIIKECRAVIGSRFHALVSALSQGVPSLGTGWSHKYLALFEDYGCSEGLLTLSLSGEELDKKLQVISSAERYQSLKESITERADALKRQSWAMWDEVIAVLNVEACAPPAEQQCRAPRFPGHYKDHATSRNDPKVA